MSLSKPIYNLLGAYFEQLFNFPVRTKCVTSCVIATSANYVSQKIAGTPKINIDSLLAYGLYGLIISGTLPHYFYTWLEKVTQEMKFKNLLQFAGERVLLAPVLVAISLYFLTRFEGRSHEEGVNNLLSQYKSVLLANWRYLSFPVFLNFRFVPPMLRVLVANLIGFFWVLVLANKRRKTQAKNDETKKSA